MGCRLTVLFHSLISPNRQSPDTFIGCNYGNAIPSTLTPLRLGEEKKMPFMILCNSSLKEETSICRAVLVAAFTQT